MARALENRKAGIFGISRVYRGKLTLVKDRTPVGAHPARLLASEAQADTISFR